MENTINVILSAFKEKGLTTDQKLNSDQIKTLIKSKLSNYELIIFNEVVKFKNQGLFNFKIENKKIVSFILTEKGFYHIYRYDPEEVESFLFEFIRIRFKRKLESKKQKSLKLSITVLIHELTDVLNPLQKQDKCFSKALYALYSDSLIYIKDGHIRLTEYGENLLIFS